ncbi:MAG: DUF3820 family protein [Elusimicrobia bacterium]|nr:DUF3820 family protein [Elusimicrobiota bacterium]
MKSFPHKNLNSNLLKELVTYKMPYGKYRGYKIFALPESYLIWYKNKGFPSGRLGEMMGLMYEIKLNGLEHLLYPLIEK